MKYVAIGLGLAALATGVLGAWYWHRSSRIVPVGTLEKLYVGPGGEAMQAFSSLFAVSLEGAKLNKVAALWTAATAFLGAASNVVGAFSN
jgi:hypothetical protein